MERLYDEHGNYIPILARAEFAYRELLRLEGKYGTPVMCIAVAKFQACEENESGCGEQLNFGLKDEGV